MFLSLSGTDSDGGEYTTWKRLLFLNNYTDTTFHTLATPSSPAVAIKSSYPFLGHHAIEFTSLTPWASSRRAISLGLGELLFVDSSDSWGHAGQN
jgi:hypothetical protein